MKIHVSPQTRAAGRLAADKLRAMGASVPANTPFDSILAIVADRMSWPAPRPSNYLSFLERFIAADSVPSPRRACTPAARPPLRYTLAMRHAAARAAGDQPRLIHAVSNIQTWRELGA